MKRRLFLMLLLIVGGAIINVAVAWGCAVWSGLFPDESDPLSYDPWVFRLQREHFPTSENVRTFGHWKKRGLGRSLEIVATTTMPPERAYQFICAGSGFPYQSLNGRVFLCDQNVVSASGLLVLGDISSKLKPPTAVPYCPLWPGFAINTIFYAAILWVLFLLPGVPRGLRRKRRITLGLCPACAYPIAPGTSNVCPECGKPVTRQKAQTQKAETA